VISPEPRFDISPVVIGGGDFLTSRNWRRRGTTGPMLRTKNERGRQVKGLREAVLIHDLKKQGLSVSAIARKVGCDRKTVRKCLDPGLEAPVFSCDHLALRWHRGSSPGGRGKRLCGLAPDDAAAGPSLSPGLVSSWQPSIPTVTVDTPSPMDSDVTSSNQLSLPTDHVGKTQH
jgi:hypothetical protein